MTNYKRLINNWHRKANNGSEDYFSRFVFEYLSFIAYLRTQKYAGAKNDRIVLQQLKQDNDLKNKYLNVLNEAENRSWDILKKELDENGRLSNASGLGEIEEIRWWNCNYDEINQQTEEEKDQVKGIIHSLDDWVNMVEFWRVVRDNLFHGSKNPDLDRNQLIVEHGYKTIKPLVDIFLSENQNDNNAR